ncbi:MAG: ORF6N domain-containing protein [Planctomycetaceae bacterium]|nr:ORF6N domain-containing protein [Planctomycetaceae bacterium]
MILNEIFDFNKIITRKLNLTNPPTVTTLQTIENSIIEIQGVPTILDADVAALYEVETRYVNQAVKNNPDKFPPGYVISLEEEEWSNLRSKILTSSWEGGNGESDRLRSKILTLDDNEKGSKSLRSKFSTLDSGGSGRGKHAKYPPKAFTEQGLYMLATILKSPKATQTTLAIIETFTKMRRLGRSVRELSSATSDADKKQLMQKTGELITDIFADDLEPLESETTIELNFALLKFKHTVKQGRKSKPKK